MFQLNQYLAPLADLSMGSQSYYDNSSKRESLWEKNTHYILILNTFFVVIRFFWLISVSCFRTCKTSFPRFADVSETLMINEDILGEVQCGASWNSATSQDHPETIKYVENFPARVRPIPELLPVSWDFSVTVAWLTSQSEICVLTVSECVS